ENWIAEGANAPQDEKPEAVRHWAFVPPLRPPLPKVNATKWPRNPIDIFILARLEKQKINPAPETEHATLIRRLSLDPIGLPATIEQKIATGFHRNTQINQEGGIDPEQFRVESIIDRVNTTATAFLGLTIGCAQCHDHKFDPIKQREYYELFAFFNQTVDDGHGKETPGGVLQVPGEQESSNDVQKEREVAKQE